MFSIFLCLSIIPSEFEIHPIVLPAENKSGTWGWDPQTWRLSKIISIGFLLQQGTKKSQKCDFSTALKIFEYLLRGPCYQAKQSAGGGAAAGWSEKTPKQFQTPSSQLLFFSTSHRRRAIKYLSSCNKRINHLNKINHYEAIKVQ